jgi:hypothetical protein
VAAALLLFPAVFSPYFYGQEATGQIPAGQVPVAGVPAAPAPASQAPAAQAPAVQPAAAPANPQSDSQAQPPSTVIDYTGSLLGYYRMEAGDSTVVLEPVQKFLAYRASAQGKDRLLLGMGDNFGPEFGSGLQLENDSPTGRAGNCYLAPKKTDDGESRPQSLYKDDDRVAPKAQCDNVLDFMMHAGFRAIVPGSQDFMYTARWLRASALLLRNAASDHNQLQLIQNHDNRLDMLGANLRIAMKGRGAGQAQGGGAHDNSSQGEGPHDRGGQDRNAQGDETQGSGAQDSQTQGNRPQGRGGHDGEHGGGSAGGGMLCPLLFAPDPFAAGTMRCTGDGSAPEPLDWLDRLDRLARQSGSNTTLAALQQLATESAFKAKGRPAELDSLVGDEISIMVSAWGTRFPVPTLPAAGRGKGASVPSETLDEKEVSDLAGALGAMPDCQAPSKAGGDEADMCVYAKRLARILRCRNALVRQGQAGQVPQAQSQGEDSCPAAGDAPAGNGSAGGGSPRRVTGSDLTLTETERGAAIRGLLRTIALEERNVGYTVATTDDGRRVLVIGVAGQDTMQAVSATNLHLCPARPNNWNGGDVFGRCGNKETGGAHGSGGYSVVVSDPVQVTEALVRAAPLVEGHIDSVVVMAQMPHTEAEVLSERVSARLRLASLGQPAQPVDVVLSQAESGYGTPQLTLTYPSATQATYPSPVLTPLNSYSSQPTKYVYPGAVSEVTLARTPGKSYAVTNQPAGIFDPPVVTGTKTTIALLYELMNQMTQASGSAPGAATNTTGPAAAVPVGSDAASSQKAEFALLKDLQESRHPRPDVVLLESRDVELDEMGPGYMSYEMCDNETEPAQHKLCMVRSALDRIFWKGDYVAYVAVTGKNLIDILNLSEQKMAEQAELADTGYTREWLISYGIVQSTLTNVTEISRNNEPLWIPVDPTCKGDSTGQSTYCIGGTPIANDAYYWLLTTDQLAQDKAVYGTLQSLSTQEHQATEMFITAPLAHYLLNSLHGPLQNNAVLMPLPPGSQRNTSAERIVTYNNEVFQQRRLLQVDFSKVVASFTSRQPSGGNQFVANFQGVSDSRATAPSQQELDLEAASRITSNMPGFLARGHWLPPTSFGVQTSFAYDRSVLGNLTPQTRPVNASYSLNNFTVGGFLQIRLHRRQPDGTITAVRSLPRSLLVFTPRQYQVQINHQYLFFPISPCAAGPPSRCELSVTLPRNDIWTDRAGFREEFGQSRATSIFAAGSYFEGGFELSAQDNVLSSLTLNNGVITRTCKVNARITLQSCFVSMPVNGNTRVVGSPGVATLHSPGFYWQLHIQNRLLGKQPSKSFSLVTDSQGDYYAGRPASLELPTQTEYAIPLSVSLVFPSMGNLSFAPSYSAFFYKSQLSDQSLQVNSLSIAARWYFARDARVPIRRQAKLPGPSSADQTRTGKAH